jgi:long-subunit fatty acid transport protein
MYRITPGAVALLLLSTSMASALGLDRSGQDVTPIFATENTAELSFGFASPTLEGTDLLGNAIEDVGEDFSVLSGSLVFGVTPQLSLGLIVDQPYGADIAYGGSPAATLLGGTAANLDSTGFILLGRYRINDSISVHGGLRHVRSEAEVTLSGLAYGPLSGYNAELTGGEGTGYVLGAAYERPDIALRVALTYQSEIELDFDTVESGPPLPGPVASTTTVVAPESWNLDVQTGIAAGTLLFGQVRYAAYSDTVLSPTFFNGATGGASITDLDDGFSYTVGVGRQLSDRLSGSLAVTYEPEQEDDLVSPLAPVNGQVSVQLGTQYALTERLTLSGGVRYTWLGDARPETGTPDTARATFEDNEAVAVAVQIGYRF